jgi:hypothetical protein
VQCVLSCLLPAVPPKPNPAPEDAVKLKPPAEDCPFRACTLSMIKQRDALYLWRVQKLGLQRQGQNLRGIKILSQAQELVPCWQRATERERDREQEGRRSEMYKMWGPRRGEPTAANSSGSYTR